MQAVLSVLRLALTTTALGREAYQRASREELLQEMVDAQTTVVVLRRAFQWSLLTKEHAGR